MNFKKGARAIAVLEASKGILVLIAGFGLVKIGREHIAAAAGQWMGLMHIDPMGKYSQLFLRAMSDLSPLKIKVLAAVVLAYACLRFAEAYGLWAERRWAEWFAVLGGAFYLPFEVYAFFNHPGPWRALVFAFNLTIVLVMAMALRASSKTKTRQPDQ